MSLSDYAWVYAQGQFALTDGDVSEHMYPRPTWAAAIHQMFGAHSALTFDSRDPETRDERYARWAARDTQLKAAA